MRSKKIMAIVLAAVAVFGVLTMPAAELQVKAAEGDPAVYTNNQATGIPGVSIQTPQDTVKIYAGLSWEMLDADISVRLNVSDSACGPLARRALSGMAASLGASEVKTLDMDLEKYLKNAGWTKDIEETNSRIRVCIALPAGSDPTKDYAVISIRKDGILEVLGDLDPNPSTITIDSDYFDTFMIVAAPAGTFDAYRVANPNALDRLTIPVYVKNIRSTINTASYDPDVCALGVLTDAGTVRAAAGGQTVSLEMRGVMPGVNAKYALDNAIRQINIANNTDVNANKRVTGAHSYCELEMRTGSGERIISTNGKLRITMTLPYSFPIGVDYAVAVLNKDGSVTIMKDIDANESTITIDTDQFRTCVFLWGTKGAFDR